MKRGRLDSPVVPISTELATDRGRAALAALAALTVSNVVSNQRMPLAAHVPWSLGLATGLVALARWAGCSFRDLAMAPEDLPRGTHAGAAGAGLVTVGYGLMAATGTGSHLFRDTRVTALGRREAWWHLLVRIPISTVLAEEVAFRGVLPALFHSPDRRRWMPGAISAVLFGVWHVLPSWQGSRANGTDGRRASARATLIDVAATTLAGGLLHFLRHRSGHLAAPAAVHLAANAVGFVAARKLGRR